MQFEFIHIAYKAGFIFELKEFEFIA